jgi:hypothetical protein
MFGKEKSMSDDNEIIEVELKDDPKPVEKEEKVEIIDDLGDAPKKKGAVAEIAPEEGIQDLKKQLEAEKNARLDAERRAQAANESAFKAAKEAKQADLQSVVSAIEMAKGRSEALKRAYSEAHSIGDSDKLAEIQEAMTINSRQMDDLKQGEKALKKQIDQAEKQPIQSMAPTVDHVEQMAQAVTPRSAAWLRENKEALSNQRVINRMFRAHEDAVDDGIQPDTDEYFQYIESRIGINRSAQNSHQEDTPLSSASAPAPKRSAPPPAAPVSRGTPRANVMQLTRAQADAARDMGYKPEEYAKLRAQLIKEGRLPS